LTNCVFTVPRLSQSPGMRLNRFWLPVQSPRKLIRPLQFRQMGFISSTLAFRFGLIITALQLGKPKGSKWSRSYWSGVQWSGQTVDTHLPLEMNFPRSQPDNCRQLNQQKWRSTSKNRRALDCCTVKNLVLRLINKDWNPLHFLEVLSNIYQLKRIRYRHICSKRFF